MKAQFSVDFHNDRPLPWPSEYDISDEGQAELMSFSEIHDVWWKICTIVAVAKFYGHHPTNKKVIRSLEQARNGLAKFADAIESAGPWLTRMMLHDYDATGEYYLEDEDMVFRLENFIKNAEYYENILASLMEKQTVSKGRSENRTAKVPAQHLAAVFREHDIPISTYQDGTFMRILSVVLKEIDPEIGEEAHRRHGQWAIKQTQLMGTK